MNKVNNIIHSILTVNFGHTSSLASKAGIAFVILVASRLAA